MRTAAVLLMVQGHAFSALLRAGELSPDVERSHSFVHGLTAPAFLFGAGLAFGTVSYGEYERHRVCAAPLRKRLERYALLMSSSGRAWSVFSASR